jgi:hypothetical protein
MKLAVIGSRNLNIVDLEKYVPGDVSEIVSGGARGVDSNAREFARKNKIPLKEFLPDYRRFGRGAPLKRNLQIIEYADMVIAFWDGKSHGTKYVIEQCKKMNVSIRVVNIAQEKDE